MVNARCDRCRRSLPLEDPDSIKVQLKMPSAYLGTVCTNCGRIECYRCRGGIGLPCFVCGEDVDGAFTHFFEPTWQGQQLDWQRDRTERARQDRLAAVGDLTDEAALLQIAQSDQDLDARLAAARRINTPGFLAELARERTQQQSVRHAAVVSGLLTPDVLADIACHDTDSYVREAAVGKTADQSVLVRIAKEDPTTSVRKAAMVRIEDPHALGEMFSAEKDDGLRTITIARLRAMAGTAADPTVRKSAAAVIKRLERPALIAVAVIALVVVLILGAVLFQSGWQRPGGFPWPDV